MDFNAYLWEEAQKEYKNCLSCLTLAKEIVTKDFIENTQPPEAVSQLRKKWLKFFSRSEFFESCHNCQGLCCLKPNFTMTSIELLYLVSQNLNFEFPEPDWSFFK